MTPTRAALYIGGGVLAAVWFSSAASLPLLRTPPEQLRTGVASPETSFGQVAAGLRARSQRLRDRLAAAPRQAPSRRNPFAFEAPASPPPAPTRSVDVAVPTAALAPAEPVLLFIGVAEERKGAELVRTAMLATDGDELLLAGAGDVLLGRYKVQKVGFEAVELSDLTTGVVRRLFLQND